MILLVLIIIYQLICSLINKNYHPNVWLINPPYSQKKEDEKELIFISHMLNCLDKEG